MRSSNLIAGTVAAITALAYAAWMSYLQWDWYLGWPSFSYAQGMVDYGWPTTCLTTFSYRDAPDTWSLSIRNLAINSGLCALLSAAVSMAVFRIGRSLLKTYGRPRFSLATLFLITIATGLSFPGWTLIGYLSMLGDNRWGLTMLDQEIPRTLLGLVLVGIFSVAFWTVQFVITLAVVACRWCLSTPASPTATPAATSG